MRCVGAWLRRGGVAGLDVVLDPVRRAPAATLEAWYGAADRTAWHRRRRSLRIRLLPDFRDLDQAWPARLRRQSRLVDVCIPSGISRALHARAPELTCANLRIVHGRVARPITVTRHGVREEFRCPTRFPVQTGSLISASLNRRQPSCVSTRHAHSFAIVRAAVTCSSSGDRVALPTISPARSRSSPGPPSAFTASASRNWPLDLQRPRWREPAAPWQPGW